MSPRSRNGIESSAALTWLRRFDRRRHLRPVSCSRRTTRGCLCRPFPGRLPRPRQSGGLRSDTCSRPTGTRLTPRSMMVRRNCANDTVSESVFRILSYKGYACLSRGQKLDGGFTSLANGVFRTSQMVFH